MLTRVVEWFCQNDTGVSSKAIAAKMCGVNMDAVSTGIPRDPADLGRCLRLLEKFPEWKDRMTEMADVSPQWAQVIPHWNDVSEMMIEEVGIDWSKGNRAPRTYALMKQKGF